MDSFMSILLLPQDFFRSYQSRRLNKPAGNEKDFQQEVDQLEN